MYKNEDDDHKIYSRSSYSNPSVSGTSRHCPAIIYAPLLTP